ncbi:MAG: hypothetical protein D6757_05940, partial [Alphaproteobacteria bacterium]
MLSVGHSGECIPALEEAGEMVFRFAEVSSTMDVASDWLMHGRAPASGERPFWILADRQHAGRGRRGRAWRSLAGNFHATLVVRCPTGAAGRLPGSFSLICGLALYDTVAALLSGSLKDADRLALKWPNDLLAGEAKLAGILCEHVEVAGHAFLLAGIGVNLGEAPALEGGRASISLLDVGGPAIVPLAFARLLIPVLAARRALWVRDGFAGQREDFRERAYGIGSSVRIEGEGAAAPVRG